MEFDVALTNRATRNEKTIHLPTSLSRALEERGYNRVKIIVDDDGMHVHPYVAKGRGHNEAVVLPTWSA